MSHQAQQPLPAIDDSAAAEPRWERWTHALGFAFVALVVAALISLLGYGVLFRNASGTGPTRMNRPAPDFSVNLFDGGKFTLSEYLGRPVVVNFWASWCGPCKKEAPLLESASRRWRSQGVVVLGVDEEDFASDARRFMRRFGVTYPNVRDGSGDLRDRYGLIGYPETFFIRREGRIVGHIAGPIDEASEIDEGIRLALRP